LLNFHVLTLFPALFESPFSASLIARALGKGLVNISLHDIRQFTTDKHRTVDDVPYGGGPGMVLKPEPLVKTLESIPPPISGRRRRIYFSPQGKLLKQSSLQSYLENDQLVLICGHYEGIDERVINHFVDEEVSIGDYVLTGGELPAMVFIDALTRLIPGVLGSEESLSEESFSVGATHTSPLLEYPQYTRPEDFRGLRVPEILLSGDHKKIAEWRRQQSVQRTLKKRPDL